MCGTLGRVLSTIAFQAEEWDLATFGDVNGDGHDDLVLARYPKSDRASAQWCFLGHSSGLASAPSWTADATLGWHAGVSATGDVNGDGYDDLVLGGSADEPVGPVLYLGSSAGLPSAPDIRLDRPVAESVGFQDVTCDDVDELLLAHNVTTDLTVEVYRSGPHSALELLGSVSVPGGAEDRAFAAAGDVNGDGCGDVLVFGHDTSGGLAQDLEQTALFLGSRDGLSPDSAWLAGNGVAGVENVFDGASVGDVDGDGRGDVMLMAWSALRRTVEIMVFRGTPAGLAGSAAWVSGSGVWLGSEFEISIGLVWLGPRADVNGDGRFDVFAFPPARPVPGFDPLPMDPPVPPPELYVAREGLPPGPFLGAEPLPYGAVATGDVNGDGCHDFIDRTLLYAGGEP